MIPAPRPRTAPRGCFLCGDPIAESMGYVLPRDVLKLLDGTWDRSLWPREMCWRFRCEAEWKRLLAMENTESG